MILLGNMVKQMANLTKPSATEVSKIPVVKPLVLIDGADNIKKEQQAVTKSGVKLQDKWHLIAVSTLNHIEQHRAKGVNADLANGCMSMLPDGVRKNAMLEWMEAHGALTYNKETKKLMFDKDKTTKLTAAEATPFWKFKQETPYEAFDFAASLESLLKRAAAAEKNHPGKNKIDSELLEKVKAIVPPAKPE